MIKKILVIEDDETMQMYLKEFLEENGYYVKIAPNAVSALTYTKDVEPDLVILDLGLPDMKGESVCMELRKPYPRLPIIILTAKDKPTDVIKGLNLGADDYVAKPFNIQELLARIKARFRPNESEEQLITDDLHLNTVRFEADRKGKSIKLTPQEFRLLEYLMVNKGRVLSRDAILNHLWIGSPDVETRVVDVYMGYLRKKIDAGYKKKLIKSVRGFGYMITE